MKKGFRSFLLLVVLFFSSPYAAMADDYNYIEKAGEKFGNGVANVCTGFLEIPKTMFVLSQSNGPVFGATIGLLTGVLHAIGRTLYGGIDMMSFMIPTKALIDPDYIWHEADKMTIFQAKVQMR
ncbi:MAG: exosortase system-associated protein, TIGR04073 family [Nitrosospira sp.]